MDWKAGQMQTVPSIQRKKRKYNSQMQKQTAQNKEGVCAEYNIAQSAFSYRGNWVIEGLHSPIFVRENDPDLIFCPISSYFNVQRILHSIFVAGYCRYSFAVFFLQM